jgi:carboxypeptidase Q
MSPAFEAEAKRWTDSELEERRQINIGGNTARYTPEMLQQLRAQRELDLKLNTFLLEEGVALRLTGTRGNFGTVFHTRAGSFSKEKIVTVPELEVSGEHFNRMQRLIKNGKSVKVSAEVQVEWLDDDYSGYNVLAEIPGTDKSLRPELVIIGAHLDSWHAGTGANDNAAGVAVMMEAVRILKTLGVQPRRTIRIALWGEEEQGLFGSRGYVQKYVADRNSKQKKEEWNKISAYYNLDNGSGKIRGIYLEGNDQLVPVFEKWFEPFHEMGAKTITRRNTGSTDHVAFDAVGIPGFQFIQDPIDYGRGYHTNMDLYERMQFSDMKQAAIIIASMVYHTAQRDEKLPRKPWGN